MLAWVSKATQDGTQCLEHAATKNDNDLQRERYIFDHQANIWLQFQIIRKLTIIRFKSSAARVHHFSLENTTTILTKMGSHTVAVT